MRRRIGLLVSVGVVRIIERHPVVAVPFAVASRTVRGT